MNRTSKRKDALHLLKRTRELTVHFVDKTKFLGLVLRSVSFSD